MKKDNKDDIKRININNINNYLEETTKREIWEKQNKKVNELKQEISNVKSNNQINNIKDQIYGDLNTISCQITHTRESNDLLEEENKELLKQIKINEEKLNNYEIILGQLKNKYNELDSKVNEINEKYAKKEEKHKKKYLKNKEMYLSSLDEIQKQINIIETDYTNQLNFKNKHIEKLQKEVDDLYNKNFELNKQSVELTENGIKTNNNLKHQINCLKKEQEILQSQKEKDNYTLSLFQKKAEDYNNTYNQQNNIHELNSYFNNIQNQYQNEIILLQKQLAEKELLIEKNKSNFLEIIDKLNNERSLLEKEYNNLIINQAYSNINFNANIYDNKI